MNKLKYALLLILCVGLIGGLTNVSAQSGERILVAGKKPLKQSDVNKLIEFYEWAFEAEFTSQQRERFAQYTSEEFRRDATGSRSTIDDIISTLPKIIAADESVQQETRKNFLAAFLPEARKNSDENSRMLLGIYETAHNDINDSNYASNNSTENSDESSDENSGSNNVGNISGLIGKWVWSRTGSSYASATTGVYAGGNGSRFTYQFSANGAVEYTGIMNVMTGGCNMQIFKTMKGRANLSGSTLTINWSPAKFTRDDSCSPSKNYTKTLPAETETVQVSFKDSYGQKQLCMTGKDETCFSPAK